MSRDLADLNADFRPTVETLLRNCRDRGCEMRPFFTLRSAAEQAILWRQSRPSQQINAKIAELEQAGAPFLAQVIRDVGPANGRHVTNAIPGLSWHQWGEAVDCFWLLDDEAEWSSRRRVDGRNGYHVYAEEAQRLDLDAGGLWRSFKDWPHVQLRKVASPARIYGYPEIDAEMRARFG
jgi:hypothetical protein